MMDNKACLTSIESQRTVSSNPGSGAAVGASAVIGARFVLESYLDGEEAKLHATA